MIRALFALLLLLGAAACERRDPAPVITPPTPALWVVATARGDTVGWLFGTIHALPDDTVWETPALAEAVDSAGVLVVEVRDLEPERTGKILLSLARDDPGPPLAQRLPTPVRRELNDLLAREGVAPGAYDALETWAAALAVSRLGARARPANGVDAALIERFKGRHIAELEGAAAQLKVFDSLPQATQRRLLAAVLEEQRHPETDARALATAWLAGDLTRLERATRRGLLADPALYEALLARRNAAWLPRLVTLFETRDAPLVAVGAAHMLGPGGLPALLAARGYTVRRVQ